MQVVTLLLDRFNALLIGEKRYFTLADESGLLILPSECPHRGGPLHLGKRSECGLRIVCPWHDNTYPVRSIARHALPAVARCGEVSIIMHDGEVRAWKETRFLDGAASGECT